MLNKQDVEKFILENLDAKWHTVSFAKEFDIFYKGQVPTAALLITEGKIGIVKRNKSVTIIKANEICFLDELLSETPLKNNIRVYPNTTLYMIDRYSILEDTISA